MPAKKTILKHNTFFFSRLKCIFFLGNDNMELKILSFICGANLGQSLITVNLKWLALTGLYNRLVSFYPEKNSAPRFNGQRLSSHILGVKTGWPFIRAIFDVNWSFGIWENRPIQRDGRLSGEHCTILEQKLIVVKPIGLITRGLLNGNPLY